MRAELVEPEERLTNGIVANDLRRCGIGIEGLREGDVRGVVVGHVSEEKTDLTDG